MKYAVELLFDPVTDTIIRAAWDDVHAATGTNYMQAVGAHPHVALTVFETERLSASELMDEIVRCSIPSTLKPVGLGSFASGVVFVAIEGQAELLRLQNEVADICRTQNVDLWEHYTPKKWVPHCTLMPSLPPDKIDAASHAISPAIYQCPWEIHSIGVITFPPTKLVEERKKNSFRSGIQQKQS